MPEQKKPRAKPGTKRDEAGLSMGRIDVVPPRPEGLA